MQAEQPESYEKMLEESAQWQNKANSVPEPCKCISVVTKTGVVSFLNLMTWQAVARPDFDQPTPSLPIAGGSQSLTMGHTVFSVCVHPSVLLNENNQPVSPQELDNILKL